MQSFAIERIFDQLADRRTVSEDDGSPIPEWALPLEWIRDFVKRKSAG
jgi:hypothetical protein